ncbi:MAG: DNA cytosine methyltransferase [Gammaproteobacteria bacterium]|nr:DNA cytosine methyltransferase [Gammaproteobacteria bacterium]
MNSYRINPQFGFNFNGLIVDSFAGGGGASTGIEMALGRPVDIAINHDLEAIKMHEVNHPQTTHYCESVWSVDPLEATGGRPVDLAWFSPDCRHFSKAKGKKPVSKRVRGLAWVVLRWIAKTRPRVIILENVEEFTTWGPLIKNDKGEMVPCPKRVGKTYRSFIRAIESHGYKVDTKILAACDYGAPTSRKRLFLIARCDGQPIEWPAKTHGPGLIPYKTAADIIDWSIPCPSIFERKKPLVENTMQRIARGIDKFVINNPDPFILNGTAPIIDTAGGNGKSALVAAFIAKHYSGVTGIGIDNPFPTITSRGSQNQAVTSHLIKMRGTCRHGQSVTKPMPTITAGGRHVGEVRAFLMKYYGTATGQELRSPLQTTTSKARFGLVTVHGEPYQIVDIGMRMLTPRELYRAKDFKDDYVIERTSDGSLITKTQQIAKCGNSVCPSIAAAIVNANLTNRVEIAA